MIKNQSTPCILEVDNYNWQKLPAEESTNVKTTSEDAFLELNQVLQNLELNFRGIEP